MKEIYAVCDKTTERRHGRFCQRKEVAQNDVNHLNRRHGHKMVQEILMLKAPKRTNEHLVIQMTESIADGRYEVRAYPIV